jgi:hypothetical protein
MKLQDRRKFEKDRYRVLKENMEGDVDSDGSRNFYVVSAHWVD